MKALYRSEGVGCTYLLISTILQWPNDHAIRSRERLPSAKDGVLEALELAVVGRFLIINIIRCSHFWPCQT